MPMTTSGVPIFHDAGNTGAAGRSFAAPSGAPASTHSAIVLMSCSDRLGSFANSPCARSAPQGGISRFTTLSRIAFAHGRASPNVSNGIGALSPARWHDAQFL